MLTAACLVLPVMLGCDSIRAKDAGGAPQIAPLEQRNGLVGRSLVESAEILVAIDRDGVLRAAAAGAEKAETERYSLKDETVQATLKMLGLEKATSFAIMGVQNPKCVKSCIVLGGDMLCTKVCN